MQGEQEEIPGKKGHSFRTRKDLAVCRLLEQEHILYYFCRQLLLSNFMDLLSTVSSYTEKYNLNL